MEIIGWAVMKLCSDIHGTQKMNPIDFGVQINSTKLYVKLMFDLIF